MHIYIHTNSTYIYISTNRVCLGESGGSRSEAVQTHSPIPPLC